MLNRAAQLSRCAASSSTSQSAGGACLRSLPDPSVHAAGFAPPLTSGAPPPASAPASGLVESAEEAALSMLSDAAAQVAAMGDVESEQSDAETAGRQGAHQTKRNNKRKQM